MNPNDPPKTYDLAIIGGGIAGAAVARDAILRGLSVVLFEKGALGSGTSSKSSKLIHGGIRYLELAWQDLLRLNLPGAFKNFRFVLSSLRETRILAHIAPEQVRPIRLFVPVYQGRGRSPLSVYAGTLLYGWLSQMAGNDATPRLYRGAKAALEAMPLLNPEGLAGAVEIADYTTDDRALVQAVADSARRNGVEIHEHTAVQKWEWNADRRFFQIIAGTQSFEAKNLVNATGPWIDKTRAAVQPAAKPYVSPVGGSHIELPAFLGRSAILEGRDGRVFFVIEKNGRARVGTTEWPCANPDAVAVPSEDIDYLLESLGRYFPSKKWERRDILSSDTGIRPLAVSACGRDPNRVSREHAIRIDSQGVLHLVGVKLTDHRRAAGEVVDRIMRLSKIKAGRSRTAHTPLTGRGPI